MSFFDAASQNVPVLPVIAPIAVGISFSRSAQCAFTADHVAARTAGLNEFRSDARKPGRSCDRTSLLNAKSIAREISAGSRKSASAKRYVVFSAGIVAFWYFDISLSA